MLNYCRQLLAAVNSRNFQIGNYRIQIEKVQTQANKPAPPSGKNTILSPTDLAKLHSACGGYFDLDNYQLGRYLPSLNITDPKNASDSIVIAKYAGFSLSASFLQMINASQWLAASIILSRQIYLPAQFIQMGYYAIFFAERAFLASQLKGLFTVTLPVGDSKKVRKQTWLDLDGIAIEIRLSDIRGKGGEHETSANWFYETFKRWPQKKHYPFVSAYIDSPNSHSDFRNKLTYSIADIAEELYFTKEEMSYPSDDDLQNLLNNETETIDCFPELYQSIEHIRMVVMIHSELIRSAPDKITENQVRLLRNLLGHHEKTGLKDFLAALFQPVISQLSTRMVRS